MRTQPHAKSFTLIELLIVVAIIAILAAIAVPNFLEAQVRSRVSRAQADFRSLAVAIEAYRVENVNYPIVGGSAYIDHPGRLAMLSTPISFISNPLLRDPFKPQGERGTNPGRPWGMMANYCFGVFTHGGSSSPYLDSSHRSSYNTFADEKSFPLVNGRLVIGPNGVWPVRDENPHSIAWMLMSYGPDRSLQWDNDPLDVDPDWASSLTYMPYDATNGTRSKGDLFRFGP